MGGEDFPGLPSAAPSQKQKSNRHVRTPAGAGSVGNLVGRVKSQQAAQPVMRAAPRHDTEAAFWGDDEPSAAPDVYQQSYTAYRKKDVDEVLDPEQQKYLYRRPEARPVVIPSMADKVAAVLPSSSSGGSAMAAPAPDLRFDFPGLPAAPKKEKTAKKFGDSLPSSPDTHTLPLTCMHHCFGSVSAVFTDSCLIIDLTAAYKRQGKNDPVLGSVASITKVVKGSSRGIKGTGRFEEKPKPVVQWYEKPSSGVYRPARNAPLPEDDPEMQASDTYLTHPYMCMFLMD